MPDHQRDRSGVEHLGYLFGHPDQPGSTARLTLAGETERAT
jgi:hypothetical protein